MSANMQRRPLGSVSVWSNELSPVLWIESQENTLRVWRDVLDVLFLPERTELTHWTPKLKGTLGSEVTEFDAEAPSSDLETVPFADGTVLNTTE